MRGGGIAGPRGDAFKDRAGELGEYHHSRNLMKKIAVGRRRRRESSKRRGEADKTWRSRATRPSFWVGESFFWPARLAARFRETC